MVMNQLGEAAELGTDPSVINAVFSVRNFWDGRASRTFNGFTPSGLAADAPGVLVWEGNTLSRQAIASTVPAWPLKPLARPWITWKCLMKDARGISWRRSYSACGH